MSGAATERDWLTSGQAAKRAGISVYHLNRYQELGWLNPIYTLMRRARRFTVAEVDALIEWRKSRQAQS